MDYRLEQLRYALREDPTSRQFYQLGELLRRTNQLDEAVQVLRQGLSHHPRYVAAYIALGRTLISTREHAQAEEILASALQLDPENAVAARLIGQSALQRHDPLRAIQALKLARALGDSAPTLEEEITAVEAELAGRGLLQGTVASDGMPPAPSAAGLESESEPLLDMEPLPDGVDEDGAVVDEDVAVVGEDGTVDEAPEQRADGAMAVPEAASVDDGEPFAAPELTEAALLPPDSDEPFVGEPFPASELAPAPAQPPRGEHDGVRERTHVPVHEQDLQGPAEGRQALGARTQAEPDPHAASPDAPRAFEVPEDDPFGIEPGSDTGVWILGADVFATDEGRDGESEIVEAADTEPEHAPDEVAAEPERARGIWLDEPESDDGERSGVEPAVAAAIEAPPSPPVVEHEAEHAFEHEAGVEMTPPLTDASAASDPRGPGEHWQLGDEVDRAGQWENRPGYGVPPDWEAPPEAAAIATPTMVRLALGQGDLELAASTLAALASDQPEHPDLSELVTALAEARRASIVADSAAATRGHEAATAEPMEGDLAAADQVAAPSAPAEPLAARKISALRSWLNTVRLANGTVEL